MSLVQPTIVTGRALDSFFKECLQAFYELCPRAARELDQFVTEQSDALKQVNGMSDKGHMMLLGAMPSFFYTFMKRQGMKRLGISDVFRDKENMRRLMRIWTRARAKTRAKDRMWINNGRPQRV
jgi:hypothetical protein